MMAEPTDTAVATPAGLTVTTASSDEVSVGARDEIGAPSSSRTSAATCTWSVGPPRVSEVDANWTVSGR